MSVVLSQPSPDDAAEFIAAARESAAHLDPWIAAPDTPQWFAAYLARAAREDQASYLIRHRDCGGLVGYANINNIVRGALQSGYLGYAAFTSHAGRGLMTAGLTAVVSDAFTGLGLHRLEANIQPDNTRSLAIVQRLGFKREGFSPRYLLVDGEWRDHERWAVLAENCAPEGALASATLDPATQDPATQDPATQDPATQDPYLYPAPEASGGLVLDAGFVISYLGTFHCPACP